MFYCAWFSTFRFCRSQLSSHVLVSKRLLESHWNFSCSKSQGSDNGGQWELNFGGWKRTILGRQFDKIMLLFGRVKVYRELLLKKMSREKIPLLDIRYLSTVSLIFTYIYSLLSLYIYSKIVLIYNFYPCGYNTSLSGSIWPISNISLKQLLGLVTVTLVRNLELSCYLMVFQYIVLYEFIHIRMEGSSHTMLTQPWVRCPVFFCEL